MVTRDDAVRVKEARGKGRIDVLPEMVRTMSRLRGLGAELSAADSPLDPVKLLAMLSRWEEDAGFMEQGLSSRQWLEANADEGDPLAAALLKAKEQ